MRLIIASIKLTAFLCACLITIPSQALSALLFKKGSATYKVQIFFYSAICFIFRIKINLSGTPETNKHVVYTGNHLSYIDIAAVGKTLPATFISKAEVANWPVLGLLARLANTIFVARTRDAAPKAIQDIQKSLTSGRSLILFPEGTSTKGLDVLPFKSTIFELFLSKELKDDLYVQPFTVTLTHVDGRPVQNEEDHDFYAWYGDMTLLPHLWQLGKIKGAEVLLSMHPLRPAAHYDNRKQFAADCHKDVSEGLKNTLPTTLDFPP